MSSTWGILSKFISQPSATIESKELFFNMEFDVVIKEDHTWAAKITSNPIENGDTVSDHIQTQPDTLDITGIISNASLSRWKGKFIEKLLNVLDDESNVQKAFDKLRKLLDNKQPVTVYTRYRNYPNMVLISLSIPRKKEDGDSIEFAAKFQRIKQVSTFVIDSDKVGINPKATSSKSIARKSENKADLGVQSGRAVDIVITEKTEQTYKISTNKTVIMDY